MYEGSGTRTRNGAFSRSTANEAAMGYYPTDPAHCGVIRELFAFPDAPVSVLEPSIGEGTAVIETVLEPDARDGSANIKIFGVELDKNRANESAANPAIEECLHADFIDGVRITNNVFSFCFGNPPYQEDDIGQETRGRMEMTFLKKVTENYLQKGAILVWVIPYRRFAEPATIRYLFNHYERLEVYRFWESEYKKWHQIVYIGRKTETTFHLAEQTQKEVALFSEEEKVPILPETFQGTEKYHSIPVLPSNPAKIVTFTSVFFDAAAAIAFCASEDARRQSDDYRKWLTKTMTQKKFTSTNMGKPPIPLKKDSLYLMATSGAGQGIAGEPGKDLHMQRGVAEVVEDLRYTEDPNDQNKEILTVTTHTAITMTIIETNGTITTLK